jgi:hypothetical protein
VAEREREPALKQDFVSKLGQAVNLGELRKQKLQVQEYVTQLENQLPGKAEMDALLSDINQAGLGRGLQFELFRPGAGGDQGLLRRTADRDPCQRPLQRHGGLRRRRRQPVAHRHAARPGPHAGGARRQRLAVDGGHRAHLPLSRCRRSRRPAKGRRRQAKAGAKK